MKGPRSLSHTVVSCPTTLEVGSSLDSRSKFESDYRFEINETTNQSLSSTEPEFPKVDRAVFD
jgi:hypothetical protein